MTMINQLENHKTNIHQPTETYLAEAETRFGAFSDAIPAHRESELSRIDERTEQHLKAKITRRAKKIGATGLVAAAIVGGGAKLIGPAIDQELSTGEPAEEISPQGQDVPYQTFRNQDGQIVRFYPGEVQK